MRSRGSFTGWLLGRERLQGVSIGLGGCLFLVIEDGPDDGVLTEILDDAVDEFFLGFGFQLLFDFRLDFLEGFVSCIAAIDDDDDLPGFLGADDGADFTDGEAEEAVFELLIGEGIAFGPVPLATLFGGESIGILAGDIGEGGSCEEFIDGLVDFCAGFFHASVAGSADLDLLPFDLFGEGVFFSMFLIVSKLLRAVGFGRLSSLEGEISLCEERFLLILFELNRVVAHLAKLLAKFLGRVGLEFRSLHHLAFVILVLPFHRFLDLLELGFLDTSADGESEHAAFDGTGERAFEDFFLDLSLLLSGLIVVWGISKFFDFLIHLGQLRGE